MCGFSPTCLSSSLNPRAFQILAPPSNQISRLNPSWHGFAGNISHDASDFAERASETLKTRNAIGPLVYAVEKMESR